MNSRRDYQFGFQLEAGSVDLGSGVLRGVTVAKAGVQAVGKFVFLDASGNPTLDEKQAKTKLPLFTDQKFLETLLGAAQDAGGRVKVRSDHDDTLDARAGIAAQFVREGDRVSCDIKLYRAYKDRSIVLETAQENPDMMGCSIDFKPSFEIIGGKAFMRVEELFAVDLVDAGAITPGGLFMSRAVDNENKDEPFQPKITMAKTETAPEPTVADCMKALTSLAETVTGLSEAFKKMGTPPPPPPPAAMSAEALSLKLDALKTAQDAFITEQKAAMQKIATERQLLGISPERLKTLDSMAEETERERLAAEEAKKSGKPTNYLAAVEAKALELKIKKSDAHVLIQHEQPELYQKHLAGKGVLRLVA